MDDLACYLSDVCGPQMTNSAAVNPIHYNRKEVTSGKPWEATSRHLGILSNEDVVF